MILPFKQKADLISNVDIWIWFNSYYMYTSTTLIGLLIEVVLHYKHDRNIVG